MKNRKDAPWLEQLGPADQTWLDLTDAEKRRFLWYLHTEIAVHDPESPFGRILRAVFETLVEQDSGGYDPNAAPDDEEDEEVVHLGRRRQ